MEYFETKGKTILVKHSTGYLIAKRILDIIVSLFALIMVSPIFIIIWMLNIICKSHRGPLLYRQVRIGLNGKKFEIYKFRSMISNAEEHLLKDKELYEEYVANNYKLTPDRDPRITKVGSFLRRTSIDEIPQFLNVLRGNMSLVGPRPVVEEELCEYNVEKLLAVKPGAMGLWQASGRSQVGYPERAEIEMSYIDRASFWFDIKIIFMNFFHIFKGSGAY
ncbi:sugar transferase [Companilactobacillus ginsenosidimutans]|uniref:Multidrug MFS transporter n=1 Tax=Companilactobacillus ginsenosidimutans TaxID=1007676 RepID=A0A0H4QHI3_9LACO|nr:sugar transferase [Companilactobacillus ginsenosidimutans]AKP67397.1 multidrug MFS transporter [Companilactobacillus ginsenosidimutans]